METISMRSPCLLAVVALTCAASAQDERQDDPKAAVLNRVNAIRKRIGLPAIDEDASLTTGCQKHAEYLAMNQGRKEIEGGGMHREEPTLSGFSEEGKKSAMQSLVSYYGKSRRVRSVTEGAVHAVDGLVATLYHRLDLISPRLTAIGVGVTEIKDGRGVVVIDASRRDPKIASAVDPVIYPIPDEEEVPTAFSLGGSEYPDPRPEKSRKGGYPVTIVWDTSKYRPTEVTAALEADGARVDFWLSTPTEPARADKAQPGVVCILPKDPLRPGTKYMVTIGCKNMDAKDGGAWSKTWSFTTSK